MDVNAVFKAHRARVTCISSLLVLALSGCATERLDQYSAFATAGSSYVANFHQVVQQAGTAMIAVDSITMIAAHRNVASDLQKNPAKYSAEVQLHDHLLQEHLAVLRQIDAHATHLASYFDAIANLAGSQSATSTGAAATEDAQVDRAGNPSLSKARLGGRPIGDYVSAGTALVVAHFQAKALDDSYSAPLRSSTAPSRSRKRPSPQSAQR